MTKIRRESCSECRGTGRVVHGPGALAMPCGACRASGERFVPDGYTQAQVESVRNLVDALAVRQGVV